MRALNSASLILIGVSVTWIVIALLFEFLTLGKACCRKKNFQYCSFDRSIYRSSVTRCTCHCIKLIRRQYEKLTITFVVHIICVLVFLSLSFTRTVHDHIALGRIQLIFYILSFISIYSFHFFTLYHIASIIDKRHQKFSIFTRKTLRKSRNIFILLMISTIVLWIISSNSTLTSTLCFIAVVILLLVINAMLFYRMYTIAYFFYMQRNIEVVPPGRSIYRVKDTYSFTDIQKAKLYHGWLRSHIGTMLIPQTISQLICIKFLDIPSGAFTYKLKFPPSASVMSAQGVLRLKQTFEATCTNLSRHGVFGTIALLSYFILFLVNGLAVDNTAIKNMIVSVMFCVEITFTLLLQSNAEIIYEKIGWLQRFTSKFSWDNWIHFTNDS
eukprot:247430_1